MLDDHDVDVAMTPPGEDGKHDQKNKESLKEKASPVAALRK